MVKKKGKGIVSSSIVNNENNEAANTETTVSISRKMNGQESGIARCSEDNTDNASKEIMNEDSETLEMGSKKPAIEEEKNEEIVIAEEVMHGSNNLEDKTNDANAIEEKDNDENASDEEEEEEEKEGDEDGNEIGGGGEGEGEGEGEDEEEEEEEEGGGEEKEEEEENQDEDGKEEEDEEKAIEQANIERDVGANSGVKVKRLQTRSKKEVVQRGSETMVTKAEDKPGSSRKKKMSKKAESMGLIFMCSSKTKKDCYRYKVLGLPASKRDIVQKVYKGMRLFLFDFDLRLMYGIYKAAGPGGYNLEPKAFKAAFPSQVRFTVLEDCLPLGEEKFRNIIKDNYYTRNKFDCKLTSEQVKNLCKLFTASKSKKLGRDPRIETRTHVGRDRIRQRSPDRERQRIRRRSPDGERRPAYVVRERIRRRSPDGERRSALVADHRYHDRPIMYESEIVAPLPRLPPLHRQPATAPAYASYGRISEMDVYSQDPLDERVESRDHRLIRLLDLDLRRRNEVERLDPYVSYREPPLYVDPPYSAGVSPEYYPPAGLREEYRPPAGRRSDYHRPAAAPSEYGRLRPVYRI